MKMSLTRLGLWAIPAAGVLTLVPWLAMFVGVGAGSTDHQLASDQAPDEILGLLYIVGLLCLMFGVLAIDSVLSAETARSWAALGMILGISVIALLVGVQMILAIVDPVLSDVYRSG